MRIFAIAHQIFRTHTKDQLCFYFFDKNKTREIHILFCLCEFEKYDF